MNQPHPESSSEYLRPSAVDERCDAIIDAILKAPVRTHATTSTFSARTLAKLREETTANAPLTIEAIDQVLFNPNRIKPSPNFTASVLEQIHAENESASQTRSRSFWRTAGTLAVAAALLMAVGVYIQQQPQSFTTPTLAETTPSTPAVHNQPAPTVAVATSAPAPTRDPVLAADWSTALAMAEAREPSGFTFTSAQDVLPNEGIFHGQRPYTGMVSAVSTAPVATQARPVTDPMLVNALLLADGLNNARPLLDSDTMQALVVFSR